MTKLVKVLLFISTTFFFSQFVYLLVYNLDAYDDYIFFGLEDILGQRNCFYLLHFGTWYVAIPFAALVYSKICRQVFLVGAESSKGKVTH